MTSPADAFHRMRGDLFRYYETPYRLRLDEVMRERRRLLDRPGATWQEPYMEVLRPYAVTGQGVEGALSAAGAPPDLVDFGRCGLLEHEDVFVHQKDSLDSAMAGQNVAVTAGTGSGKTEAFLLPVIASILAESMAWSGSSPPGRSWWDNPSETWSAQRDKEAGRLPGIRALLLYPMNALVEDQLVRLRKALDSPAARAWLDTHRYGHRIYFGRYTGKTPVSGRQDNPSAVARLRRHLKHFAERADRVANDERRSYLPRLDGGEMVSRWDMQTHPPDVLITNYSMLNIALMRRVDQGLIDKTRTWLESSTQNVFHVVVDELHMYRGTTGTEVAYLLRQLLHRLGLVPDSPQVRFIATSASLGDIDAGRQFLAGFFGAAPESFDIHAGQIQNLAVPEGSTLQSHADRVAGWSQDPDSVTAEEAAEFLSQARVGDVLAAAAHGRTVALQELDAAVFPDVDRQGDLASPAFHGLLNAIERAATDPTAEVPRIRTHLFFRNIDGMWACLDPECPEVEQQDQHPDRRVGKLWARPRHRCDCGARVLRLMYCQTCGDLFFGGFLAPSLHDDMRLHEGERFLVAELGDLESLPDQARERETSRDFTLYWPRAVKEDELAVKRSWTRSGYTFEFRPAAVEHASGRLEIRKVGQTGWTFEVSDKGVADSEVQRIPPLPIFCPQCGTDWEMYRNRPVHDRSRTRSPIRTMGTGYEKLAQVLIDGLVRQLRPAGEKARRLVLFSDSRQDAAKLSAGLEKRHYQDLLRELIVEELLAGGDVDVEAAISFAEGDRSEQARQAWREVKDRFPDLHAALNELRDDEPGALDRVRTLSADLAAGRSVTQVAQAVEGRLVDLGVNPAGPDPSTNREPPWRDDGTHWTDLYHWPEEGAPTQVLSLPTADHRNLRHRIDSTLLRECLLNVFSGNGRDLESLALALPSLRMATVSRPDGMDEETFRATVRSSLRILGDDRRLQGVKVESPEPPANLRRYWAQVAEQHDGVSAHELRERVTAAWGPTVLGNLIQPEHLRLQPPGQEHWECPTCARRHLDRAGGICTSCSEPLPPGPIDARRPEDDYYAYRAMLADGGFRLHSEELTGQTDDHEGAARQARFQDVFLHDENPRVDAVDVLSVTTTMEAGVDIGSLRAIVMSNMPPMRFNYQQRVGRAGRRRDPFSFALTVCRDRSHDEYYFGHPERITNDPPPSPYIDLSREEILRRSVAAAVLRDAFRALKAADSSMSLGSSVHGEFGSIHAWPDHRAPLARVLSAQRSSVAALVDALLRHAPAELRSRRDAVVHWATDDGPGSLLADADASLAVPSTQQEVSQHLAERGVLPMFGFPTRVRDLFLRRPTRTYPWPPAGRVDRKLELATIDFAPGAETVRDKQVHTAVGLAAYQPAGPRVVADKDPLGRPHALTLCRRCGAVNRLAASGTPAVTCAQCSASAPDYGPINLSEPAGFRSSFRAEDFEGSFTRSARATTPRVLPDLPSMTRVDVDNATSYSGTSDVFIVNDNGGRLYRFAPTQDEDSWISVDLWNDPEMRKRIAVNGGLRLERQWEGAIGMVKTTDTLLLGVDTFGDGIDPRPFDPGRRGAWYSLAFLLRAVGSRVLDVGPQEFDAGYSVRQVDGRPYVEAFLADVLENGAGYATRLGSPEQLPALLESASQFVQELEKPPHNKCDSSCPDCLRDFSNLVFHPLLDWRLGRDILELALGKHLDTGRWEPEEEALAAAFAADFFGQPVRLDGGAWAVDGDVGVAVIRHPLEAPDHSTDPEHSELSDRMDRAYVEAEMRADGRPIRFVSSFDLQRRPGWVVSEIA